MRTAERRKATLRDSGASPFARPALLPQLARAASHRFQHDFSGVPVSDAREADAHRIAQQATAEELDAWTPSRLAEAGVRLHTGERAAAAARVHGARAFTFGDNIVLGARSTDRRLLAHELVHVAQQRAAGEARIDRAPLAGSELMSLPAKTLDELLAEITRQTAENLGLRRQIDAAAVSSAETMAMQKELDAGREHLIELLNERITLLEGEIGTLSAQAAGGPLQSTADDVQSHFVDPKLAQYEAELKAHRDQLRTLDRWKKRERIAALDAELAELDASLAAPVTDDWTEAANVERQQQRDALAEERKKLPQELLSDVHEYKQGDPRWGKRDYGPKGACSNIATGGCGPAALAMVLNFLFTEDPELISTGNMEVVLPPETAAYAETHGRVCGHGTNGTVMVTNVHTQWPGYRGKQIKLASAPDYIRAGTPVIFLCKNCVGSKKNGGTRKYEGHFMVLSGVDDTGKVFNVLDSGDSEANDIETISSAELAKHVQGFWVVERK